MHYKYFFITSSLLFISCNHEDKKKSPNYDCSNLITQFNSNSNNYSNNNFNSTQYIANGCENIKDIPGSQSTVRITYTYANIKSSCTGVAISDYYVLTAAHCLLKNDSNEKVPSNQIFISSESTVNNNIKRTRASESFIHPMFNKSLGIEYVPLGDIAIIKTINSVKDLNISPIKVTQYFKEGEKVLSIGYGKIAENNEQSDGIKRWTLSTLRKVKFHTPFENYDHERYNNALNKNLVDYRIAPSLHDSFLIMNRENNYEGQTCNGDSGGPQFINRKNQAVLISITQGVHYKLIDPSKNQKNGDKCIKSGSSSNTYIAPYFNWINSILEKNNEKLEYIENN